MSETPETRAEFVGEGLLWLSDLPLLSLVRLHPTPLPAPGRAGVQQGTYWEPSFWAQGYPRVHAG